MRILCGEQYNIIPNRMCGGGAGNRGSGLRCLRVRLFNRSGDDDEDDADRSGI